MVCNGKISVVEILFYVFGGYNYVYSVILIYLVVDDFSKDTGTAFLLFVVYITSILGSGGALIRNIPMIVIHLFSSMGIFGSLVHQMYEKLKPFYELRTHEKILVILTPSSMLIHLILGILVLREVYIFKKSQDKLAGTISKKTKDALLKIEEADETNNIT